MAEKERPLKVFAIEDNGGEKKYWHEVADRIHSWAL